MWLSHVVERDILPLRKFPSFRNHTTLFTKAIPRIYHMPHNSRFNVGSLRHWRWRGSKLFQTSVFVCQSTRPWITEHLKST